MTTRRRITAGVLLAAVVVVLSGCGLGPGDEQGSADLLVTRDYGRTVLLEKNDVRLDESTTVMRMLDAAGELETGYGGGFVESVDGLAGGSGDGRSFDWFYSVNGVVADRGAAEYTPRDGDLVWWDHRDWTDAMEVRAVVGAFPAPLVNGYNGQRWPVRLECPVPMSACQEVRERLEKAGVELDAGADIPDRDRLRVVVATWSRFGDSPEGKMLAAGPRRSGVFARFNGTGLVALDELGQPALKLGPDAGLVAALRKGAKPPVWLITGGGEAGVAEAAGALSAPVLARRYAAVVQAGRIESLPIASDREEPG